MLKIGDKAPLVISKNQHDEEIKFPIPNQKAVLFFYPKDSTPGCTAEACSLRDDYTLFKEKGYEVIGVSVDPPKSHIKFIEKYDLPYPLMSDTDKSVVLAYGVWGRKKFMGREYDGTFRTTFIVDENGIITHILDKIDTKNAGKQLLELL